MSKMKDTIIVVEELITAGKMSFREIADFVGWSYNDVNMIAEQMMQRCIWDCDH